MIYNEILKKNESLVFTPKELEVMRKKLRGVSLGQQDSNYLSKYVRPKLKEISEIDAKLLLDKIDYNQKIKSIEKLIIKVIKENLSKVDAIVLYGSVIQNNYHDYNDIDIIIVTKIKLFKNNMEKWRKESELKNLFLKHYIKSDIQIYSRKAFEYNSNHNPSLIYQLKDHKLIYGKLNISNKIKIYNADLHMKLDWSDLYDTRPRGEEIYRALRNTVLVKLLLRKIVDNKKLKESLYEELGKNLIDRLKNNKESKLDRKIAITYLKELIKQTREEIKGDLWEKIEI